MAQKIVTERINTVFSNNFAWRNNITETLADFLSSNIYEPMNK